MFEAEELLFLPGTPALVMAPLDVGGGLRAPWAWEIKDDYVRPRLAALRGIADYVGLSSFRRVTATAGRWPDRSFAGITNVTQANGCPSAVIRWTGKHWQRTGAQGTGGPYRRNAAFFEYVTILPDERGAMVVGTLNGCVAMPPGDAAPFDVFWVPTSRKAPRLAAAPPTSDCKTVLARVGAAVLFGDEAWLAGTTCHGSGSVLERFDSQGRSLEIIGVPRGRIVAMAVVDDSLLLAGTDESEPFLLRYAAGEWSDLTGPSTPHMVSLTAGPDGSVYAIDHDHGLHRLFGNSWNREPLPQGLLAEAVIADEGGDVWVVAGRVTEGRDPRLVTQAVLRTRPISEQLKLDVEPSAGVAAEYTSSCAWPFVTLGPLTAKDGWFDTRSIGSKLSQLLRKVQVGDSLFVVAQRPQGSGEAKPGGIVGEMGALVSDEATGRALVEALNGREGFEANLVCWRPGVHAEIMEIRYDALE